MNRFKHNMSKRYFVTGPQRSGTTISARMIAHDTGYRYIDEFEFNVGNRVKFLKLAKLEHVVIHCPGLMRWMVDVADEQSCVVVVKRAIDEIIRSQERIGWSQENIELKHYNLEGSGRKISEVKYEYWESTQKALIPNYMEIDYHSWKDHPLWVDDILRKNFRAKQTRLRTEQGHRSKNIKLL